MSKMVFRGVSGKESGSGVALSAAALRPKTFFWSGSLALALSAGVVCQSNATPTTIAGWLSYDAGNFSSVVADVLDPSLTSAVLQPGMGLSPYSDASYTVFADWPTQNSPQATEFLEIELNVQNGDTVNLTTAKLYAQMDEVRLTFDLRSDEDSFASSLGTVELTNADTTYSFDLSSMAAVTGTRTFRLYGYNADSIGVFFKAANDASIPGGGFLGFEGNVNVVPEPSGWALLALGVMGVLAYQRPRSS